MNILLGPAHFRDVDQAFNAVFKLYKSAIICDVCDLAFQTRSNSIFGFNTFPRIRPELFHAKRNTLGFRIDLDDLNVHRLANFNNLAWVVDPFPAHISDVEQAINAAKVNERAIIGDVLDDAFADGAFSHLTDNLGALFCAALFKDSAAGDNNVSTRAVHLQDRKRLLLTHKWANVANRADINL